MSAAEEIESSNNVVEKNALGIEYTAACSIGTRLKNARESHSISKEYVARKAKIRERYIDAIELGDWDILPPGLNGRGLVRLYAKELGVSLPEFEGFQNLQTIQAEKQSENLSHSNFTKKSRYQPAAEESAEIIKIVPRSEYKSVPFEDNFANTSVNNSRELPSASHHNKLYHTKTHHTASIVTPKISEIIGVELSTFDVPSSSHEAKMQINSNMVKNDLNILPLAMPVNKPHKIELAQVEPVESELKIEGLDSPPIAFAASPSAIKENISIPSYATEQMSSSSKFKKIILYSLAPIILFSLIFGIYRINSHQNRKLNSQPLLNSERHLVGINEQKNPEGNNSIPAVKEHPLEEKILLAQPLAQQPGLSAQAPAIERSVKVDILARVKLQIDADGKEIFSGYHQPGPLEFNFKDKAEILVYDASKVKLTYGSWDHGELGWNERKRKITLNAKPYEE